MGFHGNDLVYIELYGVKCKLVKVNKGFGGHALYLLHISVYFD